MCTCYAYYAHTHAKTLLTSDYIEHKVIPVSGFDAITAENERLFAENDEVGEII